METHDDHTVLAQIHVGRHTDWGTLRAVEKFIANNPGLIHGLQSIYDFTREGFYKKCAYPATLRPLDPEDSFSDYYAIVPDLTTGNITNFINTYRPVYPGDEKLIRYILEEQFKPFTHPESLGLEEIT